MQRISNVETFLKTCMQTERRECPLNGVVCCGIPVSLNSHVFRFALLFHSCPISHSRSHFHFHSHSSSLMASSSGSSPPSSPRNRTMNFSRIPSNLLETLHTAPDFDYEIEVQKEGSKILDDIHKCLQARYLSPDIWEHFCVLEYQIYPENRDILLRKGCKVYQSAKQSGHILTHITWICSGDTSCFNCNKMKELARLHKAALKSL